MNERIKELAEQAGFNHMGIWNTIGIWEYHEKFAELIIQECMNAVDDSGGDNSEYHVNAIKKHFGEEE